MKLSRQEAFQQVRVGIHSYAAAQLTYAQLRSPCVELSSVALKFRGRQASLKDVLHRLEAVRNVLSLLGEKNALDPKLAEYAFFPLTHLFNEAQRLSSSCLEGAVSCVILLVRRGWQSSLSPEMGKQLLILMTFVASPPLSKQPEPPSDELKEVCIHCIEAIIEQLSASHKSRVVFDELGSKNVVDQIAYMLIESVTDSASDNVQFAASQALLQLICAISSRVLLASLLPRTASSLSQVLKIDSNARRTRKVLVSYLQLLTHLLKAVLADNVVFPLNTTLANSTASERNPEMVMDEAWLKATASQVRIVLIQVTKLRYHDSPDVHSAVAKLCRMVATECSRSLADSIPVVVETLISVSKTDQAEDFMHRLLSLAKNNEIIEDLVKERLHKWVQSLPRTMQGNDTRSKLRALGNITASIEILQQASGFSQEDIQKIIQALLGATSYTELAPVHTSKLLDRTEDMSVSGELQSQPTRTFEQIVLNQSSESEVLAGLQKLLAGLASTQLAGPIAQHCIDQIGYHPSSRNVSTIWLALQCLHALYGDLAALNSILVLDGNGDEDSSPASVPRLISDLYTTTLPVLNGSDDSSTSDWRLQALAIESTVMQAQQLDVAYRPELMDTLYPIVSCLGASHDGLRSHALCGLDLLAQACRYDSTSDMLIDNVDYLINSVALRLNSFDISPQAPKVILMMLKLCGARIVPYLDDIIGSIFSALDNFHGYPSLTELLFRVLKGVVDEVKSRPGFLITNGTTERKREIPSAYVSTVNDIVGDLRRRKSRKQKLLAETPDDDQQAPRRPWKSSDAESAPLDKNDGNSAEAHEIVESNEPAEPQEDTKAKLTKPHQLLLDIAKSTSPHLSSPSPQVRHLLLGLIEEVAPLLGQDENTFLPLINAIWPSLVGRLFNASDDVDDADTSYNVCAAANTIVVLCKSAGNFMSTRIEDISPRIRKLFAQSQGSSGRQDRGHLQKEQSLTAPRPASLRNGKTQVVIALSNLMITIIDHVRVSAEVGDTTLDLLGPPAIRQQRTDILQALERYNADAVWLLRYAQRNQESDST